jgi:hypothetical protein
MLGADQCVRPGDPHAARFIDASRTDLALAGMDAIGEVGRHGPLPLDAGAEDSAGLCGVVTRRRSSLKLFVWLLLVLMVLVKHLTLSSCSPLITTNPNNQVDPGSLVCVARHTQVKSVPMSVR